METLSPYSYPGIRPEDRPMTGLRWCDIERAVYTEFGLPREEVFRRARYRYPVVARQFIFYLIIRYKKATVGQVEKEYGYDHSTIKRGIQHVEDLFQDKFYMPKFCNILNELSL